MRFETWYVTHGAAGEDGVDELLWFRLQLCTWDTNLCGTPSPIKCCCIKADSVGREGKQCFSWDFVLQAPRQHLQQLSPTTGKWQPAVGAAGGGAVLGLLQGWNCHPWRGGGWIAGNTTLAYVRFLCPAWAVYKCHAIGRQIDLCIKLGEVFLSYWRYKGARCGWAELVIVMIEASSYF